MSEAKRYLPYSDAVQRLGRDAEREIATYLSSGQAARAAGVSVQYMTSLAREKRVYAIQTALGWLFEPGCVERFAADRRHPEDMPIPSGSVETQNGKDPYRLKEDVMRFREDPADAPRRPEGREG